jgi:diadenosine tetraphosphate (Ap4A) HIT family hydrolase
VLRSVRGMGWWVGSLIGVFRPTGRCWFEASKEAVTGAPRINYAVLSNAEPHLHAHLIPRQPASEALPSRPPWNDPRDLGPLGQEQLESLSDALARLLK